MRPRVAARFCCAGIVRMWLSTAPSGWILVKDIFRQISPGSGESSRRAEAFTIGMRKTALLGREVQGDRCWRPILASNAG